MESRTLKLNQIEIIKEQIIIYARVADEEFAIVWMSDLIFRTVHFQKRLLCSFGGIGILPEKVTS